MSTLDKRAITRSRTSHVFGEIIQKSLNTHTHSVNHVTQTPEETHQMCLLPPSLSALASCLLRGQTFQRRSSLVETRCFRQQNKRAEVPQAFG